MANAGIGNGVSGNGGGGGSGSTSSSSSNGASGRYANCDENSSAEGASTSGTSSPPKARQPDAVQYENIYEAVNNDSTGASNHAHPAQNQNEYQPVQIPHQNAHPHNDQAPSGDEENIYESIEDLRRRSITHEPPAVAGPSSAGADLPGCSSVTYGRIGNTYGRIDVIGHGIGRIERHLSSSCGSGIDNHYGNMETVDPSGRISKVSVQWLLVNKWLPLWIANTDGGGRDYRIIDFLLGHRGDYEAMPPQGVQQRECNGFYHQPFAYAQQQAQQAPLNQPPQGAANCQHPPPDYDNQPIYQPVYGQNLLNPQAYPNQAANAPHHIQPAQVHQNAPEQGEEENVPDERPHSSNS